MLDFSIRSSHGDGIAQGMGRILLPHHRPKSLGWFLTPNWSGGHSLWDLPGLLCQMNMPGLVTLSPRKHNTARFSYMGTFGPASWHSETIWTQPWYGPGPLSKQLLSALQPLSLGAGRGEGQEKPGIWPKSYPASPPPKRYSMFHITIAPQYLPVKTGSCCCGAASAQHKLS